MTRRIFSPSKMRECFALSFIRGMGQPYPRQSILIIKLPFFGTFIYSRLFENLYVYYIVLIFVFEAAFSNLNFDIDNLNF